MPRQELIDWLFRIGIYWGVKIDPSPQGLLEITHHFDGQLKEEHTVSVNRCHVMARWLTDECEGPWKIKLHRPHKNRRTYLTFARVADAMIFRLMMP